MVSLDVNKVKEQLESLKNLPNLKEVIALRKRLQSELKILSAKEESKIEIIKFTGLTRNQKISKTLKKRFRYLRLIRNQFPEISWLDLRREFSRREKGQDSKVPDVVWQNPSP
jgi:hypothetical protein